MQERHDAFELGVVGAGASVAVLVPDVHLFVLPSRIARRALAGSLFHGVAMIEPIDVAQADSKRPKYSELWPIDHGAMAPSSRLISGSGTTRSGSTSLRMPRPVHSGQAPYGELNEKDRGSGRRSTADARWGTPLLGEPPLAVGSVLVAIDEVQHDDPVGQTQCRLDGVGEPLLRAALTVRRSTTTSMSCFSCFFNLGGSVSWWITPSTRTRE